MSGPGVEPTRHKRRFVFDINANSPVLTHLVLCNHGPQQAKVRNHQSKKLDRRRFNRTNRSEKKVERGLWIVRQIGG